MIAPKLPSFFKAAGHRQFEFRPRYYNAEEEERKRRYKAIAQEMGERQDGFDKEAFRSNLQNHWHRAKPKPVLKSFSMLRLVLIAGLLLYISYTILA